MLIKSYNRKATTTKARRVVRIDPSKLPVEELVRLAALVAEVTP